MKRLILVIAFVTSLGALANAQQKTSKTPAQKADHKTQGLQKKLNLTASQAKQVNAVLLTEATRLDSLKANTSKTDRKANRATRKAIAIQADQKMDAILNADQKKALADLKAAKKEKHHQQKADTTRTANQ